MAQKKKRMRASQGAKGAARVALLRGINVGRAKRVAMADLRQLVTDLGYDDVRTLLNSGNVVFTSRTTPAKAAARIERAIEERLGVSSRVTVLSGDELETAVDENPLVEVADNPSRLFVAFLADPADRKSVEPLLEEDWESERFALGSRAAYVWCPDGVRDSRLSKEVGRALGDGVTTRNWSTVKKLQALVAER
jgi:uncharacterized protein (DUF1697 family)